MCFPVWFKVIWQALFWKIWAQYLGTHTDSTVLEYIWVLHRHWNLEYGSKPLERSKKNQVNLINTRKRSMSEIEKFFMVVSVLHVPDRISIKTW